MGDKFLVWANNTFLHLRETSTHGLMGRFGDNWFRFIEEHPIDPACVYFAVSSSQLDDFVAFLRAQEQGMPKENELH